MWGALEHVLMQLEEKIIDLGYIIKSMGWAMSTSLIAFCSRLRETGIPDDVQLRAPEQQGLVEQLQGWAGVTDELTQGPP